VAGGIQITFLKDIFSEDYLKQLGLNERQMGTVQFIKKQGKISNSEFQDLFGVSKATATRDLTELVDKWGILDKVGLTGVGTVYKLKRKAS
jgi:ATP-dependent DNA helicase RecG